ncbi:MAG TPA: segregation/condensation protein A [Candidatus Polarisedimenticolia bacterium]|nr:segregation/condensation protein A [Candidatus Polarisedimenticolia bacterium]
MPERTEKASADRAASAAGAVLPKLILPAFEGPLDLLLHLIRAHEIDITDIPIVEICRQYDAYLQLMQQLDLEIAGDFLVMAATLAHIKSRMLLPPDPAAPGEQSEDPRAGLVRQLLDHQKMKAAAEMLRERDELQADTFLRGHGGEDPLAPYRGEKLLEVSLFDLLSAFKRLIETLEDAAPLHVKRDEISVSEKIAWLLDRLQGAPEALSLRALLAELATRAERIAAFLAVLELVRLRLVAARQARPLGEILLASAAAEDEAGPAEPEEGPGGD